MYYAFEIDSEVNPMGGKYSNAAGRTAIYAGTATGGSTPIPSLVQQLVSKPTVIKESPVIRKSPAQQTIVPETGKVAGSGGTFVGGGGGRPAPVEEEKPATGGGSDEIFGIDKKFFWGSIIVIGAIWAYKKFKK